MRKLLTAVFLFFCLANISHAQSHEFQLWEGPPLFGSDRILFESISEYCHGWGGAAYLRNGVIIDKTCDIKISGNQVYFNFPKVGYHAWLQWVFFTRLK